jgi:hypothetical protein
MESQNRQAMTQGDAGMVELEVTQLADITGGICQIPIIVNGHIVPFPIIPGTHPRIL